MSHNVFIIIRACNLAHFLAEALESVKMQSYRSWEAVILDNASDDNTEAVVAPYVARDARFRYVKNAHRLGCARNLNWGLKLARGYSIAILDGDDLWRDRYTLTKLTRTLFAHPEVSLVAAGAVEVDERGRDLRRFPNGHHTDRAVRERILIENIIAHNSVCYRKKDVLSL
jgi:glycosyltransferase involved in cell wall biosynthesis